MSAPESTFWICLGTCAHWLLEIQDSRNRLSEWGLICKQLSLSIAPRIQGLCGVSGSPQSARTREVAGDALVPAEEGWTARLRRGRTAASPFYPYLNSVRRYACSALAGLERLQPDFC